MATIVATTDIRLRPLPYLNSKWLRADLLSALRSPENLSILWNNLIKDNELYCDSSGLNNSCNNGQFKLEAINAAGNVSYAVPSTRRYYCGAEKLTCACCSGYCRPDSNCCNCMSCRVLDGSGAESSKRSADNTDEFESFPPSDSILDSWLWCQTPSEKKYFFNFFYAKISQKMKTNNFDFLAIFQVNVIKSYASRHCFQSNAIYHCRRLAIR